jgi:hypothetical protein
MGGNLSPVTRTRVLVAVAVALLALWAAPAALAQSEVPDEPAIVVEAEESEAGGADEAWTFRYLVPTVLVMAGLTVAATVVLYGVRVRGRYRVVR